MRSFILIADANRARLYFRSDQHPQLKEIERWQTEPSQTLNGPKNNPKRIFIQLLAEALKERLSGYDELILLVPRPTLGDLRKKLDSTVQRRLLLELDKDFTHLSTHELQPLLQALLGPRPIN